MFLRNKKMRKFQVLIQVKQFIGYNIRDKFAGEMGQKEHNYVISYRM